MSETKKLNKAQEKEVAGGAILSRGHKCKKCGKEFDTVLPDNWMNPTGIGGMPIGYDDLKKRREEHEMRINYCYECLKEMKK